MYHDQRIFAHPDALEPGNDLNGVPGDCWKACIASLLGVGDYDSVPHFVAMGDQWWSETFRWVWEQTGKSLWHWRDPRYIPEGLELFIGSGPSPRGPFYHAVIVDRNGKLIHDPHPSRVGVTQVEEWFGLI